MLVSTNLLPNVESEAERRAAVEVPFCLVAREFEAVGDASGFECERELGKRKSAI